MVTVLGVHGLGFLWGVIPRVLGASGYQCDLQGLVIQRHEVVPLDGLQCVRHVLEDDLGFTGGGATRVARQDGTLEGADSLEQLCNVTLGDSGVQVGDDDLDAIGASLSGGGEVVWGGFHGGRGGGRCWFSRAVGVGGGGGVVVVGLAAGSTFLGNGAAGLCGRESGVLFRRALLGRGGGRRTGLVVGGLALGGALVAAASGTVGALGLKGLLDDVVERAVDVHHCGLWVGVGWGGVGWGGVCRKA